MSEPKINRVLANADAVIAVLAERGPTSHADIAEMIAVARPTVYRLIEGLEAVGLADVLADSRVTLSMRWLKLADAVAPSMPEWRGAQDVLDEVAEKTSQTAFLTVPRPGGAMCIAWAQGRGIDLLELKPGRRLPYHAGAAGRATLAHSSQDVINAVMASEPFEPYTVHTFTSADALREDIIRSRDQGYTLSDEDVTIGIGALGVPVVANGVLAGAVSVGGLRGDILADTTAIVAALRDGVATLGAVYATRA